MTTQPNLIFVFADQLRYQSVGFAGDKKARTPRLDQLAVESTNCVNTTAVSPVCAAYRASLVTGKYSSSTGMVINELRINPNHDAIGKVLHRNHYDTYYIGKWHLWANQLGNHTDPNNSFTPPGPYRLGFDGYWAAYNFHHLNYEGYYHLNSPEKVIIDGYEPDAQTALAIEQLRHAKASDRPFAMFLSYGIPHDPWDTTNVPESYWRMFEGVDFPLPSNYKPENDPHADDWAKLNHAERAQLSEWMRGYYAMVASLDDNIGRLLDGIKEIGLEDNTIFVFTSDHGEMFGSQGRRAKNIFYDEAAHVPFLIRYPEHIPAGRKSDVCLNTPDIAPTLLSLLNLPVPDEMEGSDLSAVLRGEGGTEPEAAFLQGMGCTADWINGYEWRALRSKQYTYAIYHADHQELLFDNVADPYQTHNLVDQPEYADTLQHFRALLRDKMAELNDTFEVCTWYRDHWTEDRIILRTATLNQTVS
jgi:arylsulfatase A-like enzyme